MPDDSRYHTKRWERLRRWVIARDLGTCAAPGCTSNMSEPNMTHVDHITEVADGGDFWDPHNLRVVCKRHHFAKTVVVAAHRQAPTSPNA